ncbi:MAG: Kelch repeat type 1-containing protein [Bacteroidetes bacterium]|nr:MAG: Kelch repeat type 1-containing protein [Bacteroidota bacterium]
MKRLFLLSVFLLLGAAVFGQGANVWMKKTAFGGSKRSRGVGFSIGSRGYIGMGEDTADVVLNDLWEYDPGTDSWIQKASLPGAPRRDAVSFVIGNKAYVGTGIDAAESFNGNTLNDFWEYDPTTNAWTARANYPAAIYFATGFAVSGKGYVCCGKIFSSNYSQQLWEYNPTTNSWLSRAPFPGGTRYGLCSFVIGTNAYVGMGTDENAFTKDLWQYTPATNTWAQRANLPASERFAVTTFTLSGYGYVGLGTDGGYKDDFYAYDPSSNTWYVRSSFDGGPRRSAPSFTIGNFAYVATGKGFTGSRRDFWMYVPWYVGVEEHELQEKGIVVYPNPVQEKCDVLIDPEILQNEKNLRFQLFDMNGRLVHEEKADASFEFMRNGLPAGTYIFRLVSETRMINSGKLQLI